MRALICLALAFGVACAAVAQQSVYRSLEGMSATILPPPPTNGEVGQRGDQVLLGGTNRQLTEMAVMYGTDIASPAGSEYFVVRIFANDGPAIGGVPSPGTLIWQSLPQPLKIGDRSSRVAIPNVTVPDTFTWTVSFNGNMTGAGGNRAGLLVSEEPSEVGTSYDFYWQKLSSTSPWQKVDNAGSFDYLNFAVTFWAGAPSDPYDNRPGDPAGGYADAREYGDDAVFEGTNTVVTSIDIGYFGDLAAPTGNETATVRLYSRSKDNSRQLTLLWTSAPQTILPGFRRLVAAVPDVATNGDNVWTVQFDGMANTAGSQAALLLRHPPTSGHTNLGFYIKDGSGPSGFGIYEFMGLPVRSANFDAYITAVPGEIVSLPTSYSYFRGIQVSGDLNSLFMSDNDRLSARPGLVLSSAEAPVQLIVNGSLSTMTPSEISVVVEASVTSSNINQRIEAFNFTTNQYVLLDSRAASTTDVSLTFALPSPADFVGASGQVRMRISFRAVGPVLSFPWQGRVDEATWRFRE